MALRRYKLDETYQDILRLARFRRPQKAAFDKLHDLICEIDDDLPRLSQPRLITQLRERGILVTDELPYLLFHLATGVGKTRLMGAIIAYLFRSAQSKNFLILAPRTAIVDRLEELAQADSTKYLFLSSALVPEPNLCFRGNLETFRPTNDGPNVFVLSPQSIAGGERRFNRDSEFRGGSLEDYLRNTDDLVVFTDEAHHLGADDEATWRAAIGRLRPRLHFGLTATPRSDVGANTLYSYDLVTCLQEGQYTKSVSILVDERTEVMSDEEWDRYTIDYALRRLARKREALALYANLHEDFEPLEPVALICARDTDHANEIHAWLRDRRGLSEEELLVTHSQKTNTESEIAKLVGIDRPGNRVRIVINVFRLTEGWDVTNVYVIAPLRAMATFQNAVQTMGRGLRLPAGERVDDPDVDSLDVLCFGKASLEDILTEATQTLSRSAEDGPALQVIAGADKEKTENSIPRKEFTIRCLRSVELIIPSVRRSQDDVSLDFDLTTEGSLAGGAATSIDLASLKSTGIDEQITYDLDDVVRITTARVVARLRYLSDFAHGVDVENLIRRFLDALGAKPHLPLAVDPVKLAIHVASEIDRRNGAQPSTYDVIGDATRIALGDLSCLVPETFDAPIPRTQIEKWRP